MRTRGDQTVQRIGDRSVTIYRQLDDKPEVDGGGAVSLAIVQLTCDMELVAERPTATWRDLFGPSA